MATIVAAAGAAGNWTSGGAWIGGIAPTAADSVQITATTTSLTIDVGALCQGADFTGFTGTLTQGASGTLTIGNASAALSNIALKMPSGFTYVPNAASTITFVSTSATQQTIAVNSGYTMGNMTVNSTSNGNYAITSGLTLSASSTLNVTKGTLHADGAADNSGLTHSWGLFQSNSGSVRSVFLGTSTITMTGGGNTWAHGGDANFTFTCGTSVITFTGSSATLNGGGGAGSISTFFGIVLSGSTPSISSGFTCTNFTRTGTAIKTDSLILSANFTVTGILTLAGNSSVNRLFVNSQTVGTARTITNTGATMTISNTDFQDITFTTTWNASAQTDIGDCGGNSGITFPAGVTQTWSGTSSGNWSTNAWTTRVPLPQDNVIISSAFSASQTVTADMPRLGKSIDWTGTTGTPIFNLPNVTSVSIFGSITLITGMSISGTGEIDFRGRGSFTITSAGNVFGGGVGLSSPGGTYTLNDAFSNANNGFLFAVSGGGGTMFGSFNANGFNVTTQKVDISGSNTRSLTMGSGTWTLMRNALVWDATTTTNLTFSGANSTTILTSVAAGTKTFNGGGLTYGTLTYIVSGAVGELDITGSNSFAKINFSDASNARSLKFTAATTTTIRNGNGFNVVGTSGKLMTVVSITGPAFTMTSTNQQGVANYLNLTNSVVDASPKWYAGANSTDNGGNTNWIFTAAPNSAGGSSGSGPGKSMSRLQNLQRLG